MGIINNLEFQVIEENQVLNLGQLYNKNTNVNANDIVRFDELNISYVQGNNGGLRHSERRGNLNVKYNKSFIICVAKETDTVVTFGKSYKVPLQQNETVYIPLADYGKFVDNEGNLIFTTNKSIYCLPFFVI